MDYNSWDANFEVCSKNSFFDIPSLNRILSVSSAGRAQSHRTGNSDGEAKDEDQPEIRERCSVTELSNIY